MTFPQIYKNLYTNEAIDVDGTLWMADRLISRPIAQKHGVACVLGILYLLYAYRGLPMRFKCRSIADKKKQFMTPLYNARLEEVKDPAYQMPFWNMHNFADRSYLIITEGEWDCLVFLQLGFTNTVSLPTGASGVEATFKAWYSYLQEYELIYCAFDNDKAGDQAAKVASRMLPSSKYRRIRFKEKDANDWLRENPDAEQKDLQEFILNAEKIESPQVVNLKDLPDDIFTSVGRGIQTLWGNLDEKIGGLRPGEVTVLTADTGSGKTTFCINLMYNLAIQGVPVWINSYEMQLTQIIRKLSCGILGKNMKLATYSDQDKAEIRKWMSNHKVFVNPSSENVSIENLKKQIEVAVYANGVKVILLDHLDYISSAGKAQTVLENINEAVLAIHMMAVAYSVHIVLVVHPKQIQCAREITREDIKGSSSIKQYADNILILTRRDRFSKEEKNKVKLMVAKNRMLGDEGAVYLFYEGKTDSYSYIKDFTCINSQITPIDEEKQSGVINERSHTGRKRDTNTQKQSSMYFYSPYQAVADEDS